MNNTMNTYNGYKNKDTWNAMLYINNDKEMYDVMYQSIYNMIDSNITKDIIYIYMYSQLESFIDILNININIDNVDFKEIYEHIYLDVVTNNKLYN